MVRFTRGMIVSVLTAALVVGLVVAGPSSASAKGKKKPPKPAEPVKSPLTDDAPDAKALLAVLEKAEYRFTPAVKASLVAFRKARALAEIAKAGKGLPPDFLAWVDADPVVAATVYGLADNAAQRLVLLRSLELDLGAEEVRKRHLQLALGITDAAANLVDPATMSNPEKGISLAERGLLKLEIKRYPCAKVDTRAKDRPLDLNDHIINFLEDNPVVKEVKVVKEVGGQKVETVQRQSRPAYACEVMSSPKLQEAFNAYMKAHGQDVAIDCGEAISPWSKKAGGIGKAYRMFRTAYEEKGRLPKAHDPTPTPAELAAYLIRNDNYRFPAGVKRAWPRFPLDAPWPVLDYLVRCYTSLREREFIWERFRDHGAAVGYGAYIGPIAQYPDMVKARKLQPFDFTYDTYPMRLKDGGVCGTCSNIGRGLSIALGVPANQASQPKHSCFVSVGGNAEKGFHLAIGQSIAGPSVTAVSGRGSYAAEASKYYAVNYGLQALLDSRIAMEIHRLLPETAPGQSRRALLRSAMEINPYNLPAATAVVASFEKPRELVDFSQKFTKTLAEVDKPGCPKQGLYNALVQRAIDARLAQLPPPADKADLEAVAGFLGDRSDALWLKYQLATTGLAALKEKLTGDLKASVEGTRTLQACVQLSSRIALTGAAIKDAAERRAWANRLLEIMGAQTTFRAGQGKKAREVADPCMPVIYALGCDLASVKAAFEADLKASVAGTRTPASTVALAQRLATITRGIRNPKANKVWADVLLAIVAGHETYDAPLPKNKGVRKVDDPSAVLIYRLLGKKIPTQEKAEK